MSVAYVPVFEDMLYQCDVECFITTNPLADSEPLDPFLDRDRQVQGGKGQSASDLGLLSHKKMCHCIFKVSLHSETSVPSLGPHRHFYPQHLLFEKKMNKGCFSPPLKREVGS